MKIFTLFLSVWITIGCASQIDSDQDKIYVINKLAEMRELDQIYAGVPTNEMKEKYGIEKAWEIYKYKGDSVNLENQIKAKRILRKFGFIGTKSFGDKASYDFWLIVQHADNDIKFQEKYLKLMRKEIIRNNALKRNFAYLEDRVFVKKGLKQRFGTQVTYNKKGQAIPLNGLIDSLNIEKIRQEYDLESLIDYYNDMTNMHFEMNKESLLKKGITSPILYK